MRRSRRVAFTVLAGAAALFLAQAALAFATGGGASDARPVDTATPDADRAGTLISVQSYDSFRKSNGQAIVVRDGEVVWRYDPPDSRVFDAEMLDGGNVLVTVAESVPNADCPPEFQDTERHPDHCVKNRVVELDYDTKAVVWEYSWYDAFIHWHEVHDADRLPSGETAIADMGNDRAFTVAENGTVTWEWRAERHVSEGTDFFEAYVPEGQAEAFDSDGPEDDWTHLNDIDRLANGHFALSVRNFDVVLEVDPETNEIVDVLGAPGAHSVMNEQHNPNALERHGTTLVADSENDRVVELDTDTGRRVWGFDGSRARTDSRLDWPRDADRLPNGHTLIADSLNFRVVEVSGNGTVVWSYSLAAERGIVYSADRLGGPEEPDDVPSGRTLAGGLGGDWRMPAPIRRVVALAGLYFPVWMRLPEYLTLLVWALAGGFLVADSAWTRASAWREARKNE